MFENNIITFNPGWNQEAQNLEKYSDIREIQASLQANSINLDSEVDTSTKGPGSIVLTDPDGNSILIDQHI